MPFADIKEFCKTHNVQLTAVSCTPSYNETKKRVIKGAPIPYAGWKDKGRYESCKVNKTSNGQPATMWMMNLQKAGLYVIDVDCTNKPARDILEPLIYDNLYGSSDYVVQTGSGGLHFYYRLHPDCSDALQNSIKAAFDDWFLPNETGSIDIIVDSIITEGSQYSFNGTTYNYLSIKPGNGINDVSEHAQIWDIVKSHIIKPTITPNPKNIIVNEDDNVDGNITVPEIQDHLNNIPNNTQNWDNWYKMGQLIYNLLGDDGYEVFNVWSQSPWYNIKETMRLWKGLKERQSGTILTIGTLLYKSKQANEVNYKKIRASYNPLSYDAMKSLIEEDHFFIQEPRAAYIRIKQYSIITYTPASFKDLLMSWNIRKRNPSGKVIDVSFFLLWSKDPNKRQYKSIEYHPDASTCPNDVYNSFVPAKASFLPRCDPIDIEPILTHFNIMANHDEQSYNFLINYFAQIVQQPAVLPGIAIVLYGEEGAGKDILVNFFGSDILGDHQYAFVGDAVGLFKGFNAQLQGKLLAHGDELNKQSMDKKAIESLKRIITSGKCTIEKKGVDASYENSYIRIFLTTNNRDALSLSISDRRFCVFNSSSEKRKDTQYFKDLAVFIKRPEVQRTFYDFLMARDISEFNHNQRPETELYREMKEASMDPVLQWIQTNEQDFEEPYRKANDWMILYNQWAEHNRSRMHNPTSFGIAINTLRDRKCGIVKRTPHNISMLEIPRVQIIEWMVQEKIL